MVIMRKELNEAANERIKHRYQSALNKARNAGSSSDVNRGPAASSKEQLRESDEVFGTSERIEANAQGLGPDEGRGSSSVLPGGRRSGVIETFESGMMFPGLKRLLD